MRVPTDQAVMSERNWDAAVELFYQHGYEATSVQEIVDRASVTKGALYHYFRSKEELLLEIRNSFMGGLLSFGRPKFEAKTIPPLKP